MQSQRASDSCTLTLVDLQSDMLRVAWKYMVKKLSKAVMPAGYLEWYECVSIMPVLFDTIDPQYVLTF